MVTQSHTSRDMASRLSHRARTRLPSAIRSLYPAEKLPGMISLLSGKPNGETFPIRRITLDVDVQSASDSTECVTLSLEGQDLEDALQYSPTAGLPRLVQWVEELQASVHKLPRQSPDWRCSIGAGSQDLLTKSLEALLDAGDTILTEKPVYPGILPQLRALGINVVEIEPDHEGVKPSSFADTLATWSTDESTRALAFPKVIYLTPTGGNPTGATASIDRKRAVLEIVRRYDLLLLEDDAYYYLDYSDVGGDPVKRIRSPSYLSMDPTAKNVLRFDSFSKVLSSGMRLGFCTGSPVLLGAIDQDSAGRNLQPSGVSQGVVLAVLEAWGVSGFLRHADRIACFYRDRRDFFEAAAKEHLLKEPAAARWSTPTAGMFLWIELLLPSPDSFELVSQRAKEAGVLAIPGMAFLACPRPSPFVRTSFSQVPLELVDEAFGRLRKVIDQAWAESGEARMK